MQVVGLEHVRQLLEQLGVQVPPLRLYPLLQELHVPGVVQVEQFAEQTGVQRLGSEAGLVL